MENNGSLISKEKLDSMATWVGSTVSSAFFSSLERFSCVNVTTSDPPDNDEDDDYSDSVTTPTSTTTTTTTTTTVNNPDPSVKTANDITNLPV